MFTDIQIDDIIKKSRDINYSDLLKILKKYFEIEKISKYFNIDEGYKFKNKSFEITNENSLLLEFKTLKHEKQYFDFYESYSYKLLILFGFYHEEDFNDEIRMELDSLIRKDNINTVVVWTSTQLNLPVNEALKKMNIDTMYIEESEIRQLTTISDFITIREKKIEDVLILNVIANLLLKRLKKLFHLILSEIAAPIYDELYGKDKIATSEIMNFEEDIIEEITDNLKDNNMTTNAVDVGCGTGRHTFNLSKKFKNVYGFDFSPSMITKAQKRKAEEDNRNILFSVSDLEYEKILKDEDNFINENDGEIDL